MQQAEVATGHPYYRRHSFRIGKILGIERQSLGGPMVLKEEHQPLGTQWPKRMGRSQRASRVAHATLSPNCGASTCAARTTNQFVAAFCRPKLSKYV
jgi:hypothetical protein